VELYAPLNVMKTWESIT